MTEADSIIETVEYYMNNPRAKEGVFCKYCDSNGNCCAVGRCVVDPMRVEQMYAGKLVADIYYQLDFKPGYKGLYPDVWNTLQRVHDNDSFWEGNILTHAGYEHCCSLLRRFGGEQDIARFNDLVDLEESHT